MIADQKKVLPVKLVRANCRSNGNVIESLSHSSADAKKYSPQEKMKIRIPMPKIAGSTTGATSCHRIRTSPAPSTLPESIIAVGMDCMYPRQNQMNSGRKMIVCTMIRLGILLIILSCANSR